MPELEIKNQLKNIRYNDFIYFKEYWKVSKQAIAFRARELNTISQSNYEYFMIELSRSGERKKEKGEVSIDFPKIIDEIIKSYKNDLNYSINEMTQLLRISLQDFNELFNSNNTLRISI
jgi:Zn-dependent peptidase ImmA (M78 family)